MTDALFDVPEIETDPDEMGPVEAATLRSIAAGIDAAILSEVDAGMSAGALLAARNLDKADRLPPKSAVYAVAQLMRPYQDALHALRLPAALSPASVPTMAEPEAGSSLKDLLGDTFGRPE